MNEKTSIDLVNSIATDKLSSVARDLSEVALDAALKEGVFRDIPVFNTIVALYQAGVEIRQHLFIKKVINFLQQLSNTPFEKRQKFVEEIEQDPRKKREFGETLVLLIDRADSLQKPSILGRLLKHHILDNISYEDVTRLSFIVDRVYISDLNYLLEFKPGIQNNPNIAASLQSAGLLSFAGMDGGTLNELFSGGVVYELNEYGKMLLRYGLDSAA
ncbi:MAG: hypothetical protein MUE44_29195 [Oscillatoriaceae cyanobacterium Prado104]|jgi:hypothetical protein|nr:hypothetical protein [Oscillatoriaceae cyanobacterium Prado104]